MRPRCHSLPASFLLAAALLLGGCRTETAGPAHARHLASIEIAGYTEVDILRAMQVVFAVHGYQHMTDLTFDKRGSLLATALYGGWNADGVWIRLKASVDPGAAGTYVIGCDAYRVTGHNQGVMEEENKTTHAYRSECQAILRDVQARLAAMPDGTSQP